MKLTFLSSISYVGGILGIKAEPTQPEMLDPTSHFSAHVHNQILYDHYKLSWWVRFSNTGLAQEIPRRGWFCLSLGNKM